MDKYNIEEYDLVDMLASEVREYGSSWNSKEKADYIYIRLCSLFNFDERAIYSSNDKFIDELFDKKINPYRVDSRKTVCNGFSNLFCDSVDLLLSGNDDYQYALTEGNLGHVYSIVSCSDMDSIYDPIMLGNDFLNVKKNLDIEGVRITSLDGYEGEYVQGNSFRSIGYSNKGISKLKEFSNYAYNNSNNKSEFFNYIINNNDYNGLGLNEVNNLLNRESKLEYNSGLRGIGVSYRPCEYDNNIKFIYNVCGKDEYETLEDDHVKVRCIS